MAVEKTTQNVSTTRETPKEPTYAMTVLSFARDNATRVDARGETVAAVELMGAFVSQMYLDGREADTEESYRNSWEAFKRT